MIPIKYYWVCMSNGNLKEERKIFESRYKIILMILFYKLAFFRKAVRGNPIHI